MFANVLNHCSAFIFRIWQSKKKTSFLTCINVFSIELYLYFHNLYIVCVTCSTVALCKLLEHGIASNDIRLNDITVKGEEMFITDGIRTRSQTQNQPPQWTHIPLLVKIYKLLVNELSTEIELNMARDEDEEEVSVRTNRWM